MQKNFRYAFIQTIPVLFGYLFLGIAFGLLLQKAGYNFLIAGIASLLIYAGSMQFVMIDMLGSKMGILSAILLTLSVNSRHIFYGLSFIKKFKKMRKYYPYMIFSLTDETYSLLCSVNIPEQLNNKQVFFFIALLNHMYWVLGGLIGSIAGGFIHFNSTGIEFAMTALFTVIFVEGWLEKDSEKRTVLPSFSSNRHFPFFYSHFPAILGLINGILCLLIFGSDNFILPALILTVSILCFTKKYGGLHNANNSI